MALKIIGAGLGRTGTLSLKLALEHLGFDPCHHMVEVLANLPDQLPRWMSALEPGTDWDAVFAGFEATVDYPGCYYWRQLIQVYPDAKVILSVRDPESWFKSVSETIFSPPMQAMMINSPLRAFFEGAVIKDLGDRIADKDFMVDYFKRWNAAVVAEVPAERLLVFEAKQGWEPLCAFLGTPVPAMAFPRVNSSEEMAARRAHAGEGAGAPQSIEAIGAMARANLQAMKAQLFSTPA